MVIQLLLLLLLPPLLLLQWTWSPTVFRDYRTSWTTSAFARDIQRRSWSLWLSIEGNPTHLRMSWKLLASPETPSRQRVWHSLWQQLQMFVILNKIKNKTKMCDCSNNVHSFHCETRTWRQERLTHRNRNCLVTSFSVISSRGQTCPLGPGSNQEHNLYEKPVCVAHKMSDIRVTKRETLSARNNIFLCSSLVNLSGMCCATLVAAWQGGHQIITILPLAAQSNEEVKWLNVFTAEQKQPHEDFTEFLRAWTSSATSIKVF